jgi:8-oxo-dGTP pyrophosphatase MutT (NUDIX family)
LSPAAPAAELRAWITSRLDPPDGTHPTDIHSDYDMNPQARPGQALPLRPAAVLVPLVMHEAGLSVLPPRRADTLRQHTGQIAFPGGRCDAGETFVEAALREAEEEIGLDRSFVEVAGLLTPYETVTGYRVIPVVGFVRPGFTLTLNKGEVAEAFEAPFDFLMNTANHQRQSRQTPSGEHRYFYAMPYEDYYIWGATAGMLRGLYQRLYGDAVA